MNKEEENELMNLVKDCVNAYKLNGEYSSTTIIDWHTTKMACLELNTFSKLNIKHIAELEKAKRDARVETAKEINVAIGIRLPAVGIDEIVSRFSDICDKCNEIINSKE